MVEKARKEWRPHGRDFDSRAHQETLLRIFDAVRSAADWGSSGRRCAGCA